MNSKIEKIKLLLKIIKVDFLNVLATLKIQWYEEVESDYHRLKALGVILLLVLVCGLIIARERARNEAEELAKNYAYCVECLQQYAESITEYYSIVDELNKMYGHSTAEEYSLVYSRKQEQFVKVREARKRVLVAKNVKMSQGDSIQVLAELQRLDELDSQLCELKEIHK